MSAGTRLGKVNLTSHDATIDSPYSIIVASYPVKPNPIKCNVSLGAVICIIRVSETASLVSNHVVMNVAKCSERREMGSLTGSSYTRLRKQRGRMGMFVEGWVGWQSA